MTRMTIALELAYAGTGFSGFARQKEQDVRTVQGCLEDALKTLFKRPVGTVCAGRTDAGVHALGQWVSFEVDPEELAGRNSHKMLVSLNALTDDDITIKRVGRAPDGFSARFDAKRREYRYRICTGTVPPQFLSSFAWWYKGSLDVEAMGAAAQSLVGEHDFKSFCKAASAVDKTTMRFVESIDLFAEEQMGEKCLVVRVVGNAFLHSMVRTIVGTLVEVGCGHRPPSWTKEVLVATDRSAAGPTAPACGLTFWKVDYGALELEEL